MDCTDSLCCIFGCVSDIAPHGAKSPTDLEEAGTNNRRGKTGIGLANPSLDYSSRTEYAHEIREVRLIIF